MTSSFRWAGLQDYSTKLFFTKLSGIDSYEKLIAKTPKPQNPIIEFWILIVSFYVYWIVFATPAEREEQGGWWTNRRSRDESQWFVGQAYSRTYNTRSQSSRLQAICRDDNRNYYSRPARLPFPTALLSRFPESRHRVSILFHLSPSKRCFPARILT